MASTDIGPKLFGFDMSSYPHQPTRSAYVVVLKKTDPSPLAPESDEEKIGEEKKPEEKKPEGQGDKPADSDQKTDPAATPAQPSAQTAVKKAPPRVMIDFDRIGQRILALPIPARNFIGLAAGKTNTIFLAELLPPSPGVTGVTLHKFDLEKRKLEKVLDNVRSFDLSSQRREDAISSGRELVHCFRHAASQTWRRARSRPRTWRSMLIRKRSGNRCTARPGASSETSSMTRITTASTCKLPRRSMRPYLGCAHSPRRPELSIPGNVRRAYGWPPLRAGRRHA